MTLMNDTDRRVISQVLKIVGARRLFLLLFLLIVGSVVGISTPVIFGYLIDGLTQDSLAQPLILFCGYAAISGSNRLLSDTRSTFVRFIENDIIYHVGMDFFKSLLKKPVTMFDTQSGSSLHELIRNMHMSYRVYVNLVFNTLLPAVTEIIATVAFVGTIINFQVGIFVLIYGTAIVFVTYKSNQRVEPVQKQALISLRKNAFVLGDACEAIRSIKLTNSAKWISERYDNVNEDIRAHWSIFHKRRLGYALARTTIFIVQIAILFGVSIHLFNEALITIGELVLFNGLIIQLNRPAELIAHSIEEVLGGRQLRADYDDILAVDDIDIAADEHMSVKFIKPVSIEFANVSFSYDQQNSVLSQFSRIFDVGSINFIIGESGLGKSTLLGLLTAFLGGYKGEIKVSGQDLKNIPTTQLYQTIAMVPQSPEILNATLADNIKMGGNYSDEKLMFAISQAGLSERLMSLEKGVHTLLGRNGVRFSGGEEQRVSIARALIRKPQILLLDEPSSALDENTECLIFEQLRTISKSVLIIAITHRTSLINYEDTVVELARTPALLQKEYSGSTAIV